MSKLQDLLSLPDVSEFTEEVYVSERLGTFIVRPMSEKEWSTYRTRSQGKINKRGADFDSSKFNLLIITGHVIEPNLADAEFLSKAKCATVADFVTKKFLAGEVQALSDGIVRASGFDAEENDINEEIKEVKN